MNVSSTEDEADVPNLNVDELKHLIIKHGGVVLKKFHGRDIQRTTACTQARDTHVRGQTKSIVCITSRPCTTYKV